MTVPHEVSSVSVGRRMVSRRVAVSAPATEIFALLADPHRHPELDGSGTLRDLPVSGPDRLTNGAKFTVAMKRSWFKYKITSTVTAFEPDRLIEWRHPAGHRWRWELSPTTSGSTEVTETFDYSRAKLPWLNDVLRQPAMNAAGITATLQALAARFG